VIVVGGRGLGKRGVLLERKGDDVAVVQMLDDMQIRNFFLDQVRGFGGGFGGQGSDCFLFRCANISGSREASSLACVKRSLLLYLYHHGIVMQPYLEPGSAPVVHSSSLSCKIPSSPTL
jgi:hypothetical protein